VITSAEIECEVDLDAAPTVTLRFHQDCFAVWDVMRHHPKMERGAVVDLAEARRRKQQHGGSTGHSQQKQQHSD
jgi:hypothetical protein